jgi:putative acetyltransferase
MRAADDVTIACERPDQPEIVALIGELDALFAGLYPAESNHFVGVEALRDAGVTFLVARMDGGAVGCGAVMVDPRGWGEPKRMYVRPERRGRGIAGRILAGLEEAAQASGMPLLRLETGARSLDALAFYRRAGFSERGPFGDYRPDPNSVFMEKAVPQLARQAQGPMNAAGA